MDQILPTGRPFEWLSDEERRRVDTPSAAPAIAYLAAYAIAYCVTLYGAIAPWSLPLNILFAIGNGFTLGQLFIIAHDCVHRCYFRSARANAIVARLTFFPMAHSASLWETGHNRFHHGKTNFKGVDYVWAPMSVEDYRKAGPLRRVLVRLNRGIPGQFLNYPLTVWLPRLILPLAPEVRRNWRHYVWDSLFVLATQAALITAIVVFGKAWHPERSALTIFLIAWGLPMFMWNFFASFTFYLQHTHPNVHWFDDAADWTYYKAIIKGTVDLDLPQFRWLPLYFSAMRHTAHHALATIPIYRLVEAGKILERRYGGDMTVYRFSLKAYFGIMKACKLYDYRNHHWTDFSGRQTGPALEQDNANAAAAL